MRVKICILFPHELTITPELAKWVLARNTTAYFAPKPDVTFNNLKGKFTFLGMLGSLRKKLVEESLDNYTHTLTEHAVLVWSNFEMTEEQSETWGTHYLVTGEVNGLDPPTNRSLCNHGDSNNGRYFGVNAMVKATHDKLSELMDIVSIDYFPEGLESVWQRLTGDTPGAVWRENGEDDPHGDKYSCPRSALPKGNLTDDELANGMFICDHRTSLESIGWLTAGKERIRWLSRRLAAAERRIAELVKDYRIKDLPGQD